MSTYATSTYKVWFYFTNTASAACAFDTLVNICELSPYLNSPEFENTSFSVEVKQSPETDRVELTRCLFENHHNFTETSVHCM